MRLWSPRDNTVEYPHLVGEGAEGSDRRARGSSISLWGIEIY